MRSHPALALIAAAVPALAPLASAQVQDHAVEAAFVRADEQALEASPWEKRIAALLAEPRAALATEDLAGGAERLAALGAGAAPALLEALDSGRIAIDPADPAEDLVLRSDQRELVRAALERLGRGALLPLVEEGAQADATPHARQRALLALELVGRAEDLELAVAAAAADGLEALRSQRALQATSRAIVARDASALKRLRGLLEDAPHPAATSLVLGVARSGRREALVALADELDRLPQLQPLLLSAIACAAAQAPQPVDVRVLVEVRERLTSADPLLARSAAAAAGALEDFGAVPGLIQLLGSEAPGVRGEAHRALQRICALGYSAEAEPWSRWLERERAWFEARVPDLTPQLAGADGGRALAALREVAAHRYRRRQLAELVQPALEHPEAAVREEAAATLSALGCPLAAPSARPADAPRPEVARTDAGVAAG
jgi:hypothetical protein